MFPLRPEGEGSPEPDIIGTAGEGRSRRHWWHVVAAGVFALAGVITLVSVPSQRHAAAPHPSGVAGGPARPGPSAPGAVPTQAWAASLGIVNWPMPGSGTGTSGGMIAGGVAGSGAGGDRGWELTVRDVARPGQRCTTAVLLYLYGTIAGVYPVSPHPALRTRPATWRSSPSARTHLVWALPCCSLTPRERHRLIQAVPVDSEIGVPILPVAACGQRYYLGGFAYPLAGRLDLSVAGSSAKPVRYLVPARLTRPKEPGVWHGTGYAGNAQRVLPSTQVRAPLRGQGHHEHHGQDCPIVCRAQNGPICTR